MAGGMLDRAKREKNDEFYTLYKDVQAELDCYRECFSDRAVLCNCDDPSYSAFWRYFHQNFSFLGLRRLTAVYFSTDTPIYRTDYLGGNDMDIGSGVRTALEGNGDFRNQECIRILDESDIVVTNPPFSLFREYIAVLMDHGKKFIVWGNNNAISYREIFPLLKDNRIWLGHTVNKNCAFRLADSYAFWDRKLTAEMNDGYRYGMVPSISVFTNLARVHREKLILKKPYREDEYLRFDELPSIINVNRVSDIPYDYEGLMAVPITFLGRHDPEQFEIVDLLNRYSVLDSWGINKNVRQRKSHCCNIGGKPTYCRLVIRKRA